MNDFERINAPRVEKIEAMIATIRKSATSQKINPEEVAALFSSHLPPDVAGAAGLVFKTSSDSDGPTNPPTEVVSAVPAAPVSARAPEGWKRDDIRLNVSNIPANQLSFYATQIVARMGEIVDTGKDGW